MVFYIKSPWGKEVGLTEKAIQSMEQNAITAIDSRGVLEGKRRWIMGFAKQILSMSQIKI